MNNWKIALRMMLVMTIITGLAYPLVVTGLAQVIFKSEADGSLIVANGRTVGSSLIAQKFTTDRYFWPRPSAADFNPMPSGASNLGPTSKDLRDSIAARRAAWQASSKNTLPVPDELVCASGSGLDPHIAPESAVYQVDRIVAARQLDPALRNALLSLIARYSEPPTFGLLGQPRINVLKLNLALDSLGVMTQK